MCLLVQQVDQILEQRKRKGKLEYLIRWQGFGEENDTWEPASSVSHLSKVLKAFQAKEQKSRPPKVPVFITITFSVTVSIQTCTGQKITYQIFTQVSIYRISCKERRAISCQAGNTWQAKVKNKA
nr:hypothetical protein BaRGS_014526 [Batillaria attramentaria]